MQGSRENYKIRCMELKLFPGYNFREVSIQMNSTLKMFDAYLQILIENVYRT